MFAFTMAIVFAEVGQHCQGGQLYHKGHLWVVSLLKMTSYTKGCNFTKEVELVEDSDFAVNGNFADESNFTKRSNAAEEVCNYTYKNNLGLSKRQHNRRSDATTMRAMHHCDEVKMPLQCWRQCEVTKVMMPAQPAMTPAR